MPPILLAVFHCSLYRERISSWGAAGLFQFPLLREGRRGKSCTTSSFLRFQFTLLREGRLPTVCHASPPKAFQFTPLREGRLDDVMNALKPILFQFTPLREGRLVHFNFIRAIYNFNSRPSARGDPANRHWLRFVYISIHAPPRGATSVFWHCALITYYFNSRPSARGDMRSENVLIPRSISIHAPPRGATNQPPRVTRIGIISIHAPPRGATWSFPPSRDYPTFQFTPLREGRPAGQSAMGNRNDFNSRPSARGDQVCMDFAPAGAFQFTPLREGRHKAKFEGMRLTDISIHAPPRGATQ